MVTGHKIRLDHQFSILIKKQMLSRQIDLHISIAVIICSMAVGFLAIYRLPGLAFPGLDNVI